MTYPNPLSDVPKVNGSSVHVPNQDADVEMSLLYSLPTKGKRIRRRRWPWFVILRVSFIVVVILLGLVAGRAGVARIHQRQTTVREKRETFEERMERRQREAREARP